MQTDEREFWHSREKQRVHGKQLSPCDCGAEGRFDSFDAAFVWVECSAECGKETGGYYSLDEAAEAWARREYDTA